MASQLWHLTVGEDPQDIKHVLNPVTLQFERQDLERLYMQQHWSRMRHWLWCSVGISLVYMAVLAASDTAAAGSASYWFPSALGMQEVPRSADAPQVCVDGTCSASDSSRFGRESSTPTVGLGDTPQRRFILWHATGCALFVGILLADSWSVGLRESKVWPAIRAWAAFAVVLMDLAVTSCLNPSIFRVMMFFYTILVPAQFIHNLGLVAISSTMLLTAAHMGTLPIFQSITLPEVLILELVCLLASREKETYARLALYRLWCIAVRDNGEKGSHAANGERPAFSPGMLSGEAALALHPHMGPSSGPLPTNGLANGFHHAPTAGGPGPQRAAARADAATQSSEHAASHCGGPEAGGHHAVLPTPRKRPSAREDPTSDGMANMHSWEPVVLQDLDAFLAPPQLQPLESFLASPRVMGEFAMSKKRRPSAESALQEEGSDADTEAASFFSEDADSLPLVDLPPWPSPEGTDNFRRSEETGDFSDHSTWSEVVDVFRWCLRGKTYLEDRNKVPASSSALALHQARLFRTLNPVYHIAWRVPSLRAFLEAHPTHFFFIYTRIVPYKNGTIMTVVNLFTRRLPEGEDPAFDRLLESFRTGGDQFRNLRLKYLCCMREAPSAVTKAIWLLGGERPVIIGKGYMDQRHFLGPNYVEIDVDVSPSRTARMVIGKVVDHANKVVMEEMLVLEGQSEEELPERPLASWRWVKINADAMIIDLDESALLDDPGQQSP